ncbi:MAG: DUF2284 domain-containing protein [Archaeoglobaceae archaeon]|nr:DUF2284 domain-containing protein [Archaeoglobaceae archaeon]MCX8152056.1 DUF2284 domain-containing protein [Archaeoglobaceae archaeon]MDW8013821.1 DUF2284 domain-containing protein [Archaeoglobaceae archaeon]
MEDLLKKFGLEAKIEKINPKDLKFDLRARWKCKFGCNYYGRPSCPPNVPDFKECVKFVRSYKDAILFRFKSKDVKRIQEFMLEAERSVKLPFALSTFPTSCMLCEDCKGCSKARPTLSALCIDVTSLEPKDDFITILFLQ